MSECRNSEVRDVLPLLASGGQVSSSAEVEAHIAACESCRQELELLTAARRVLLHAPTLDAGRIARAIPAYGGAPLARSGVVPIESRRRTAPAWRIAAAALIVVASGTALAVRQAGDDPVQRPVATAAGGPAVSGSDTSGAAIQPGAGAVAEVTGGSAGTRAVPETGAQMTFGGGLDDLSEDELVALLAALDGDETITPAEPDEEFPSMSLDAEEES